MEFNEFQRAAIKWAVGRKRGVAVAPPGSGKSLFVTGLFGVLRARGVSGKLLVLTKSKAFVAIDKANFAGLSVVRVSSKDDFYWLSGEGCIRSDIVLVSTAMLPRIVGDGRMWRAFRSLLGSVSLLVIDEVHNYRGYGAKVSRALRRVTDVYSGLVDGSDGGHRIFGVTATPVVKALENWFSVFGYIEPRLFGSWAQFQARYCVTVRRRARAGSAGGGAVFDEIVGYKCVDDLSGRMRPYLFVWGGSDFTFGFHLVYYGLAADEAVEYNRAIRGLGLDKEWAVSLEGSGVEKVLYLGRGDTVRLASGQEVTADALREGQRVVDGGLQFTVAGVADRERDASYPLRLVRAQEVASAARDKMRKLLELLKQGGGALVYFAYLETVDVAYRYLVSSGLGKRVVVITGAVADKAAAVASLSGDDIVLGTRAVIESLDFYFDRVVVYQQITNNSIEQFLGRCSRYNSPYRHIDVYFFIREGSVEEYFYERMRLVLRGVSTNVYSVGLPVSRSLEGVDEGLVDMGFLKRRLLWRPQLLDAGVGADAGDGGVGADAGDGGVGADAGDGGVGGEAGADGGH